MLNQIVLAQAESGPNATRADGFAEIVPPIAFFVLVFALAFLFRGEIKTFLRKSTQLRFKFGLTGAELNLTREKIDQAAAERRVTVSEEDRYQAIKRLELVRVVFEDARILWVDDNPSNNMNESSILIKLGAGIDRALTSKEAEGRLRAARTSGVPYHAVISDMSRDGNEEEGIEFANRISEEGLFGRTVIYMGRRYGGAVPQSVHGVTNRPNDLLHYVADVLERENVPNSGEHRP